MPKDPIIGKPRKCFGDAPLVDLTSMSESPPLPPHIRKKLRRECKMKVVRDLSTRFVKTNMTPTDQTMEEANNLAQDETCLQDRKFLEELKELLVVEEWEKLQ